VKRIFDLNNITDREYKVKIGDVLLVPGNETDMPVKTVAQPNAVSDEETLFHTVQEGETLFRISKMYNTTPEAIKQLNNMNTDGVNVGQVLKVKGNNTTVPASSTTVHVPSQPVVSEEEKQEVLTMKSVYVDEYNTNEATYFDKGMATWIEDTDAAGEETRFYALHKTAASGTILKVRNLMNDKVAYVKVVGKLPDIEENRNVLVKVSGATAKYLDVIDPKFLVEVSYVHKKN